jgi:membrane protease YdiL (CAAX protease family)
MQAHTRRKQVDTDSLNTVASPPQSPLKFFLLVFALSLPFWWAGTLVGPQLVPGVPVTALIVVFCPTTAALILVYRESKTAGVRDLLKRSFDYNQIKAKIWYAPILLLMPGVTILSYGWMRWMGLPLAIPQVPVVATLTISLAIFILALGEELGWSGYAIDPMQDRWGALSASILLGLAWALWHIVPLVQVHRSPAWIAWWCLGTVAARVLMVWLYNNTGKSVFAMAVFHTTINVTWQLFPIRGSYWDPRVNGVIMAIAAVVVVAVWGPRTLAGYRNG